MISAMAAGETRIDNFATGTDCASTVACLTALGVEIRHEGKSLVVKGVGKSGFSSPTKSLDCGNSGTTMRLLAGILAGQNFDSVLVGDGSLVKRPMNRIIEPLSEMGAVIGSNDGKAPLTITGNQPIRSIEYRPPIASAQIKSCILLAGLNALGETSVIETVPSRDHTERMLRWFGTDVGIKKIEEGSRISVSGDSTLTARNLVVPADISSAAYFMVAAACLKGSDILFSNVGFNPSRRLIVDVLRKLGANIELRELNDLGKEPVASIRVRGGLAAIKANRGTFLQGDIVANLIDEIPILAILGTQLESGIEIRDAAELRVKESDRVSAIVANLKNMGASVAEFPDGFKVERSRLKGASIDSMGDHRIVMAFAIAGLFAEGETQIHNATCTDISFPGFFETLAGVVNR
jgi:3-phosphoshikimate 1-carboxyvinyltransferase